jgi:hypothetical protein
MRITIDGYNICMVEGSTIPEFTIYPLRSGARGVSDRLSPSVRHSPGLRLSFFVQDKHHYSILFALRSLRPAK